MKIEKLAMNKTKVTLYTDDLIGWDISTDSLRPDSPRLKDFIISIIRQADYETGFLGDRASIMIEATPHADGFVFVLTSSDLTSDLNKEKVEKRKRLFARQFKVVKKGLTSHPTSVLVYRFDSFDDVCDMLTTLSSTFSSADVASKSNLYRLDSTYYLRLVISEDQLHKVNLVANEFAIFISAPSFEAYLAEHAQLIADCDGIRRICKANS